MSGARKAKRRPDAVPGHALVVGGTGMLAGAVSRLAGQGWRVSVLARRASQAPPSASVRGWDCDYHDEAAFRSAVTAAVARDGPIALAIAWFHTLKIPAPRRLAEAVGAPEAPGRYLQVLGSAVADPTRPDRLATAAAVGQDLPNCRLRQVVLGFRIEGGSSRWLSNDEISTGVLDAIARDAPLSVIGVTAPWSARPGG